MAQPVQGRKASPSTCYARARLVPQGPHESARPLEVEAGAQRHRLHWTPHYSSLPALESGQLVLVLPQVVALAERHLLVELLGQRPLVVLVVRQVLAPGERVVVGEARVWSSQ